MIWPAYGFGSANTPEKSMPIDLAAALAGWEKAFRAEARSDNYAIFRQHIQQLDERGVTPERMLEATIDLVRVCCIYHSALDGQPFKRFLGLQRYNHHRVAAARYVFTFRIGGHALGRVLVSKKHEALDLADLYGHPWEQFEVVGFRGFWISHPLWTDFTRSEPRKLERKVTADLRYDYTEDEVDIIFHDQWPDRALVTVQDQAEF